MVGVLELHVAMTILSCIGSLVPLFFQACRCCVLLLALGRGYWVHEYLFPRVLQLSAMSSV